jgi:hypothetical protein
VTHNRPGSCAPAVTQQSLHPVCEIADSVVASPSTNEVLRGAAGVYSACWRRRRLARLPHAQQSATSVIVYLSGGLAGPFAPFAVPFREGLKVAGYVEGRNVAIEYRWAEEIFGACRLTFRSVILR